MKRTLIAPRMRYPVIGTMLRPLRIAPLLLLGVVLSCQKDGGTPAFARLSVPAVMGSDGSIPSNVTDVWVYANDQAVGVWEPGRRIPILEEGPTTVKLIAGVRRNGVTNDRIQYPFYATNSQQLDLVAGQEIAIQPVFTYFDNTSNWFEGFEGGGSSFDTSEGDTTFIPFDLTTDSLNVRSGDHAAGFVLDGDHQTFRAVSEGDPALPNGTSAAFLEIDYRSDIRFLVGVRYDLAGQTYTDPYVYVSPSVLGDGTMPWKHIYIDLATAWGGGGSINRRFYIQGTLDGGTIGHVTIDNVKVVF